MSAILGQDVPDMLQLQKGNVDIVLATTTRAQAQAEAQVKARMEEKERCSGAVPNPIDADELHGTTIIISGMPLTDTTPPEEAVWGREFDEDLFKTSRERVKLTKKQRRQECKAAWRVSPTHQDLRSHSGHARSCRDGRRKMSPWNRCKGKCGIKTPY